MSHQELDPTAELVKPPQSRRGKGWSVVYKQSGAAYHCDSLVYIKRQAGYFTRVWWRCFRKTPRLICEHRALRFCQKLGIPTPEIVAFNHSSEMTELILKDVGPAKEFGDYVTQCDVKEKQRIIEQTAKLIGKLHARNWVHGALGDEHLLVKDSGEVVLIDLEKAHWNPLRIKHDIERLWRHIHGLTDEDQRSFMDQYRQFLDQ